MGTGIMTDIAFAGKGCRMPRAAERAGSAAAFRSTPPFTGRHRRPRRRDALARYGGSVPLASLNSVLYKGYLYDPIMGTYWLGRRHYDPMSGRFLEPDSPRYLDPQSAGGLNPYLYCSNDPIAYADNAGNFGVLVTALIGLAVGALTSTVFETGKQLIKNNWDWNSLDWVSIGRQAIIGGALGFVGGVGARALGGLLGGTNLLKGLQFGAVSGAKAAIWFGVGSAVSFAGGVGAYAVETFGHGSDWDWGEAAGSGLMGMAAGMMAYLAGGASSLVIGSNLIARFAIRQVAKSAFSFPLQFAEGILIDYLS